MMHGQ